MSLNTLRKIFAEIDTKLAEPMGTDATKWAEHFELTLMMNFSERNPPDQAFFMGWFANAIMAGHDAGYAKGQSDLSSAVADRIALLDWFNSQPPVDTPKGLGERAVEAMQELAKRRTAMMPQPPGMTSTPEPIPTDVFWSINANAFFDTGDVPGKPERLNDGFQTIWYARRAEFPQRQTAPGPGTGNTHHDPITGATYPESGGPNVPPLGK